MAKKVFLKDITEDTILTWHNVIIDVCRSHTLIHKKHETIRLPCTVESRQTFGAKTVVYYTNGYYLVINA